MRPFVLAMSRYSSPPLAFPVARGVLKTPLGVMLPGWRPAPEFDTSTTPIESGGRTLPFIPALTGAVKRRDRPFRPIGPKCAAVFPTLGRRRPDICDNTDNR